MILFRHQSKTPLRKHPQGGKQKGTSYEGSALFARLNNLHETGSVQACPTDQSAINIGL